MRHSPSDHSVRFFGLILACALSLQALHAFADPVTPTANPSAPIAADTAQSANSSGDLTIRQHAETALSPLELTETRPCERTCQTRANIGLDTCIRTVLTLNADPTWMDDTLSVKSCRDAATEGVNQCRKQCDRMLIKTKANSEPADVSRPAD